MNAYECTQTCITYTCAHDTHVPMAATNSHVVVQPQCFSYLETTPNTKTTNDNNKAIACSSITGGLV